MVSNINIEKVIQNLLFDNDCVIVPGFGGFVTVYQPAKILPKQGVMTPPSREIGFNKKLVNNDGLLANHISIEHNLSFEKALNIIQNRVSFYTSELNNVKRLEISNVGVLYIDKDGNYRFMPDEKKNFLKKSFGLSKVYLDKVEEKKATVAEVNSKEGIVIPLIPEENKSERKMAWAKLAGVIAIPLFLFGGGFWLAGKLDSSNTSAASLNPFEGKSKAIVSNYESNSKQFEWENSSTSSEEEFKDILNENSHKNTITYSFENDGISDDGTLVKTKKELNIVLTKKSEPSIADVSIPEVTKTSNEKFNFYIVGGAFQDRTNADKLVNKLVKKGFDAHVFAKRKGMHYVCFDGFETKADAKKALTNIKKITPSAWIKAQ